MQQNQAMRATLCAWYSITLVSFMIGGGCAHREHSSITRALGRFEFKQPQMGLPFRIVLYAPANAVAESAAAAAFGRIKALNDILSDYDAESEVSKLSRTSGEGIWTPVSPDLWIVLSRAQDLAARSGGAF